MTKDQIAVTNVSDPVAMTNDQQLTEENAAEHAERFLETVPSYPNEFDGRGIVTCAGGVKYNTCAWVLIKMLRHLGVTGLALIVLSVSF